jgi:carboxypeptidase Taq
LPPDWRHDVRITTRWVEGQPLALLFGTMHEAGHAMYEQGVGDEHQRTILEGGASLGVHESQSRLWENMVGRSRRSGIISSRGCRPPVRRSWRRHGRRVSRGNQRVQPTLIRVEADEATYNLHIMLRVELELALIEGSLRVADLPEAWNTRCGSIWAHAAHDATGVLQDIHWSAGLFGYFATYTLGNVIAAQLWERFGAVHPSAMRRSVAATFAAAVLAEDGAPSAWTQVRPEGACRADYRVSRRFEPYLRYLETKYSVIATRPRRFATKITENTKKEEKPLCSLCPLWLNSVFSVAALSEPAFLAAVGRS